MLLGQEPSSGLREREGDHGAEDAHSRHGDDMINITNTNANHNNNAYIYIYLSISISVYISVGSTLMGSLQK